LISSEGLLGLAVVGISAVMVLLFTLLRGRRTAVFRPILPLQRLRQEIDQAVEDGTRLHISLGNAGVTQPNNASALAGLAALESVSRHGVLGDRPPLATSGEGTLAILSQDALKAVHREEGAPEQYHPDQGRLTGVTPLAYAAGAIPLMRDLGISANIFIGNYGPEIALVCEAAERADAFTLAVSDSLPAQAVLYAAAQEPLIGEELFAVPAYLQERPAYQASLNLQDVLRWIIVLVLAAGAGVKIAAQLGVAGL
jgi:hypothetical protein